MKKSILTIALICGMALLAGAQDIKLSAGAGVNFQPNSLNLKAEQSPVIMEYGQNATSLGINAFFDATYAVVNVEYATQLGKSKNKSSASGYPGATTTETEQETNYTYLNIGLLGKFPITVAQGISVFPLLGVEYDLNLGAKDKETKKDDQKADLNDLFVVAGVGADIGLDSVVKGLYVRPLATFGYNLTGVATDPSITKNFTGWTISGVSYKMNLGVNVGFTF